MNPTHMFRRRLALLVAALAAAVLLAAALVVGVQRDANEKILRMAHVELGAAIQTRDFRGAVDDLHGALLRVGTETADDSEVIIKQRREKLDDWLSARNGEPLSDGEREIVRRIGQETRAYFARLDAVRVSTGGWKERLERDTVIMFDDNAIRLQSIADQFAAAHDEELRQLLKASLASLHWMRNLTFFCIGLLVAAIATVLVFVYVDVVRPLRERLVDNEALLAKREKLAALGTLAAGVAHEIRNPLTAIKARLYTLRRGPATAEGKEDVQAIAGEVDRLERIVRDVLGYARPADATPTPVDLSAWLREFADFARPELVAAGLELRVDTGESVWVEIDANHLRQVMLNLVRNAREAFEARPGRVDLALRRERATLHGKTAEIALLSVEDNGPGIPAAVQARLFDPFFTTKASGTGLGLSIVARLVESLGGEIRFQSSPGAGTRFVVCLPIREPDRHPRAT